MKFIAFTDTHGNETALDKLKKHSKDVEFMVCCGDFTVFGHDMTKLLKKINSFHCKVFLIPGNHEDPDELADEVVKYNNIIYVEDKLYADDDLLLFASSGNGFIEEDEYFDSVVEKYYELIMKQKKERNYIAITHAPPYKTKLDPVDGRPCGNNSVKAMIKYTQPIIAFSGHLHENEKKRDRIKGSIVLNPGDGAIIQIEKRKIKRIDFIR